MKFNIISPLILIAMVGASLLEIEARAESLMVAQASRPRTSPSASGTRAPVRGQARPKTAAPTGTRPGQVTNSNQSTGSGDPYALRSQPFKKWTAEVGLYSLISGAIGAEINTPMTRKILVGVGAYMVNSKVGDLTAKGFSLTATARYSFGSVLESGVYAGAYAGYGSLQANGSAKSSGESFSADVSGLSAGLNGGYAMYFSNFMARAGIAYGLMNVNASIKKRTTTTVETFDYKPNPLGFELNAGWTF